MPKSILDKSKLNDTCNVMFQKVKKFASDKNLQDRSIPPLKNINLFRIQEVIVRKVYAFLLFTFHAVVVIIVILTL